MDEGVKRAFNEVEKRSPHLSERMKKAISESVGLGAIKYSLVNVTPLKKVVFDWEKALNFDVNSAPFIQYAYARACNILKKADKHARNPDYTLLKDSLERNLLKAIALFPEVFVDAVNVLEPNQLAEYVNDLAAKFNSFYAKLPVLKAETRQLRDARLDMVEAFKITVGNTLNILGIGALERM
jgi:arginyl-tRNA synthetase